MKNWKLCSCQKRRQSLHKTGCSSANIMKKKSHFYSLHLHQSSYWCTLKFVCACHFYNSHYSASYVAGNEKEMDFYKIFKCRSDRIFFRRQPTSWGGFILCIFTKAQRHKLEHLVSSPDLFLFVSSQWGFPEFSA